jgi:hypothetical protein
MRTGITKSPIWQKKTNGGQWPKKIIKNKDSIDREV